MKHDVIEFLTPKQMAFCNEYLIDFNATRAALQAGYSSSTALNGQLMAMPKIKAYLQEKMADATQKAKVTHAKILKELCKIAFGNMGNFFAADGSIKPMNELSDDDKAGLWSVSVADTGSGGAVLNTTKFRMYNKLSALDKIAKHVGFYEPEQQEAQTIYKFVTPEDIDADDSFDDELLAEEMGEWEVESCEDEVENDEEDALDNELTEEDNVLVEQGKEAVNSDHMVLADGCVSLKKSEHGLMDDAQRRDMEWKAFQAKYAGTYK